MKARILVVGGAGYIGSHVAKALAKKQKAEILTFDNLSTGYRQLVREGRLLKASLLDPKKIRAVVKDYKPHAIFHFANFAQVGESVAAPEKYYGNNVVGTFQLLEAVRESKKKIPIIFSSSCAVYGNPQRALDENHPLQPVNPYGNCKKIVEEMLFDYQKAHGIPFVSLRYFNAAGADLEGELGEMHEPETHLIPRLIKAALGRQSKKDPVRIWGGDYQTHDGTCIRDYVHVDDLASAHLRALSHIREGGESLAVNLGSERGYSVLEILAMVRKISREELIVPTGPRRPGDPDRLVAVATKAKKLWDWSPKIDLETIVTSAWNWEKKR